MATPDTIVTKNADGGVTIEFGAEPEVSRSREIGKHDENLAEEIEDFELSQITSDILAGIEEDDRSRQEWIGNGTKGLDLLALKLEAPRSDLGSSAAPMEGMSNVRHPLLLEACLRFHANAVGELLPADGPIKIADLEAETAEKDAQADRLEKTLNAYLTSTCTEYYPDTDKMLFGVGYRGAGFKKLFHCPLRRRPVSESVEAKDLIVSNNATDLQNATRITQVIRMNKSTLRRMQIVGAYLDVDISYPNQSFNRLDAKEKRLQGIEINVQRVEDTEYTLYECYCDLDIPGYEHKIDGKPSGLPLPYKVTIDKSSRQVLEIRRNWNEDDGEDLPTKRKVFVMYPFVPMFGFYPMGLLNILGNTTGAVTAAWRILLDAGMFGNFPGFLYAKNGARQANNNFRVAPGSGAPVDIGGSQDIRQAIIPLPYKTPDPASMQLVENIAQAGQRVGGTAEMQVGEGRQDAPVGTTLALIEQAAKIMDAVHKRICAAQDDEFQILRELIAEDPECLWRHNKRQKPWNVEELLAALNDYDLVPKADPNTPSHMHRIMKAQALKQLAQLSPAAYDMKEIDTNCMRAMRIGDPDRFFAKGPPPGAMTAPDPAMVAAQAKIAADQAANQTRMQANQVKLVDIQSREKDRELDRQSKMDMKKMDLMSHLATHPLSAPLVAESGI